MNGREMLKQTSAKQTNTQRQAWQLNKQMVELQTDARCPTATAATPKTMSIKRADII